MTEVLTEQQYAAMGRPSEEERVEKWERDQFKQLGFEEHIAEMLAMAGFSWHEADDLLRGGCPHVVALSILL